MLMFYRLKKIEKMKTIEIVIRIILFLIGLVVKPLLKITFVLLYGGSYSEKVPKIQNPLCLQSATRLAKMIRNREVTAVEVMQAFIQRAQEVNPIVNAIIAERYNDAMREAQEVDEILDNKKGQGKYSSVNAPFLGVPLSVKEAFAAKGMPNASGLISRKGSVAEEDAEVVKRLKQAGAIPFIITNVSELCMWYESANRLYGRTKNPYNTGRIVGGSSGGEGCVIAAGASVMGIGSDIGGSIRMPSFFNGIFGHRPSRGLVPNDGQFPIADGKDAELLSTGPMCRYSEDLLPLLKVYAGPKSAEANLDKPVDIQKLKFFYMEDDGGSILVSNVDPELKAAQNKVVEYLRSTKGLTVEKVEIHRLKYSLEIWSAKMLTGGGTSFCEYMADKKGKINAYKEFVRWLFGRSNHTLPAIALGMAESINTMSAKDTQTFLQMCDKLDEQFQSILGSDGVFLYPSHPKIAPYHNEPIFYPFNFAYTGIFNALGYPVTQVPLGLSKEGLPLGLQVVGTMKNDRLTIAVAMELEKAFKGWVEPSS